MTYKDKLESVYKDVGQLALQLYRSRKTFTQDELINWINKNHPDLPNPYKGIQGVLQAVYDRTDNHIIQNAIPRVFVNNDGIPLF